MVDVLAIFAVGLAGGVLPLFVRWNERRLHTALALSTGIFLGAVFLHFLPSLSNMGLAFGAAGAQQEPPGAAPAPDGGEGGGDEARRFEAAAGHLGHEHGGEMWLWLFVLIGVLGVYLVEALVLRSQDHDDRHRHQAVGYAALVGLTVHALTDGIGYAAAGRAVEVSRPILVAILGHKAFETFSLTTVFQLAGAGRARILAVVAAFALITPAGLLLGRGITAHVGPAGLAVMTALAAGTFLYVCLCELLVEVFHHREDTLWRIALLTLGIAVMVAFERLVHA